MFQDHADRKRLRFGVACAGAVLIHAALLCMSFGVQAAALRDAPAAIEVDVILEDSSLLQEVQSAELPPDIDRPPQAVPLLHNPGGVPASAAMRQAGSEQAAVAQPGSVESNPQVTEPTANPPRKPIRLFLRGDELSSVLKQNPPTDARPRSPDLWQELRADDAERGMSPASPAIAASYQSARFAPAEGSARVDVKVDAQGQVVSVRLVQSADSDRWAGVVQDLLARLKNKKLRLPAGAKGMNFRLRIDRGMLTIRPGERGRTTPGPALGQEAPPRGIVRDDSARASFEESGRISPTLRVLDSAQLGQPGSTRIVLESLNSL